MCSDTSRGTSSVPLTVIRSTRLALLDLCLTDCWRALHPTSRDYTHHSALHKSHSRIDLILLPFAQSHLLQSARIGCQTWSDHCPVDVELRSSLYRPKASHWRLNDTLLQDAGVLAGLEAEVARYFNENDTPDVTPPLLWEAHKASARGYLIKQGARLKRERAQCQNDLIHQIRLLETSHKSCQSEEIYAQLTALRADLNSLLDIKAQKSFLYVKRLFFEHGNKCGRLLARALRKKRSSSYISRITDKSGTKVTLPTAMLSVFREHFRSLYNLDATTSTNAPLSQKIENYLRLHIKCKLPLTGRRLLESPISEEELLTAVKETPSGKAPGPDGFSLSYYKKLMHVLQPYWLSSFNSLTHGHHLHPATLTATITLLPKPGRDPDYCSNYRPISLLNQDIKLFAKILATRLKPYVPGLVHLDQTGFIPGREARDSTVRAINLIQGAPHSPADPLLLLSTDCDKAFDRVRWDFLFRALTHMGFGDHMLMWIRALYTNPCARVNINGVLSGAFPVANGTRQGCPLSPLLFALSLEPFLQAVRSAPDITGLEIGASEHRLAAYADDLLFFIRSPLITLPNLLRLFAEYGALSNLKLNMDKSEILPISVPATLASNLQSAFPFRWCQGPLKYLGTYLSGNPGDLYTDNYGPLLRSVENDLRTWDLSHITWFGRINAIKMSILPKILYLFQTIPITLPRSFFRNMDSLFRTYVWNGRPPRVKLGLLTTPRSAGGMSMPHVQRYYHASHLQRMVEWGNASTPKAWVGVEKHFAGPALASVPW
uniref:Reverse transcriptase domain-containing protein n=1 Tax=Leptobrachium leishanense TaxID=445787 RepID=A0A8C5LQH7_9ANUR